MKQTRFCPAKINLFLEVTGKRPNGYHELATLFAKINVGDQLTVCAQPANQTSLHLQLTGPVGKHLRADETNLVCRAARGFLEHFGLRAKIELTLEKRIPIGAGLGGGSSDAAHTLLALCDLFQQDKTGLLPLAASLGADVPLFMYDEPFLKGEGIGERLTPVPAGTCSPGLVLIYPNTFVSTKMVFANFHLPPACEIDANCTRLNQLITCVQQGLPATAWKPYMFNRLEAGVTQQCPGVKNALEDLTRVHPAAVLMSGSGSTVFALTDTLEQARCLATQISGPGRTVFCTSFYSPAQ